MLAHVFLMLSFNVDGKAFILFFKPLWNTVKSKLLSLHTKNKITSHLVCIYGIKHVVKLWLYLRGLLQPQECLTG